MADRYRSLVEHGSDWSIRMTAGIGERVAWFRERTTDAKGKKMTVQALADRCAALGLPLGRVTITKLERGMRQAVTPAEVIVLAAALNVPPLELIYPIGQDDDIEALPGRRVPALRLMEWLSGELAIELRPDMTRFVHPEPGEESTMHLLRYHAELVSGLRQREADAAEATARVTATAYNVAENPESAEDAAVAAFAREDAAYRVAAAEEWRKYIREPLRRIRAEMRRRGVLLPALLTSLSDVDEVTTK